MKRKQSEVKQKILHMLQYAQRRDKTTGFFPYGLTLRHIAGTTRMSPLEEHRASVAMADLVNSGQVVKTKVDKNGKELERVHYRLKEETKGLVLEKTKMKGVKGTVWQPVQLKTKEKVVEKLGLKSKQKRFVLAHEAMHAPHAPRLIKQPASQVTLTVTTDVQTARVILGLIGV